MTRVLVPAFITASLLIGWNDVLPAHEAHDYEWVLVTRKASFAPRDGAGALVYEDRMWLLGGWNPGDKKHFPRICNNEVWSSKDGAAWDLMKANTFVDRKFQPERDWEGRHTAGYVVHRGKMWMWAATSTRVITISTSGTPATAKSGPTSIRASQSPGDPGPCITVWPSRIRSGSWAGRPSPTLPPELKFFTATSGALSTA